jgi:hypothetical protein
LRKRGNDDNDEFLEEEGKWRSRDGREILGWTRRGEEGPRDHEKKQSRKGRMSEKRS